jgi:Tol biopolymer transport system component/DNA-binding winged helix-turn-helix (wHTH) protein
MGEGTENLYEFSGFRLDMRERTLRRDREIVPLQPKTIDVLCVLVARAGELVTKSELMEAVWADSFVEESNLTQSVYTLRRTLGEHLIETMPRRGYRFAAPVKRVSESPAKGPSGLFRSKGLVIAVAALIILIPAAIFTAYRFSAGNKPADSPVEKVEMQRLTFSGNVLSTVIAPDGRSFAFSSNDGLFLQDIGSGSSIKLDVAGHKFFGNLQFSPDGEHIYFRDAVRSDRGGNVFRVSRLGGAAQKVIDNVWSTPGFSPDGKQIAFIRFFPERSEFSLVAKQAVSGEERSVLSRTQPNNLLRLMFPAWSPDSKKVIIVEHPPGGRAGSRLLIVDVASGISQALDTPRFTQLEQAVWHPETGDIYLAGRENNRFFQLWRISYPGGDIKRITNDLNIYRYISLSADGRSMLARQGTSYSHLWTAGADDLQNLKQLTTGNLNRDGIDGLAWTPGGEIVYTSRIMGAVDIWSLKTSDGSKRQLTDKAGSNNESPFVSADGKYIFFNSNRDGVRHVWRMGASGEGPVPLTKNEKERDFWPNVSPDGQWLYYIQKGQAGNIIFRRSLADDRAEALTEPGKVSPDNSLTLSPDGRFLAFGSTVGKEEEGEPAKTIRFGIMSVDPLAAVRFVDVTATVAKIFWSPGGKSFEFIEETPEGARLWRQGLEEGAQPALLLTVPKDQVFGLAWSTDGKTLAISRGRQVNDAILLKNFE